ncbi:MAG: response regulator transcription factor [Kineosporiaceae bacterium]
MRVGVHVRAQDPVSEAGLRAQLENSVDLTLLSPMTQAVPDVLVYGADRINEQAISGVRSHRSNGRPRVVMVVGNADDADLVGAVEAGVCAILRRSDTCADRLVSAVHGASRGEGVLPSDVLGTLLAQVGHVQRTVLAPRGLHLSGLSDRELDVLRLVAEGMPTNEIAEKMAYSERTVKNVLHEITQRLGLRNRTHAVAYAMRHGLL